MDKVPRATRRGATSWAGLLRTTGPAEGQPRAQSVTININICIYMKQSQTEVHSVKLINVITRCQRPVCTRPTATCQCVLINIWDSNETRPKFLGIMAAQWKSFCNFYEPQTKNCDAHNTVNLSGRPRNTSSWYQNICRRICMLPASNLEMHWQQRMWYMIG